LTVKLTVVVWVRPPDMPVIVMVTVPMVAPLEAVNVNALVLFAGFVPNVAVTPLGTPEAERETLPLKPLIGVTVMVVAPLGPPCAIVTLPGDAERLKSGLAVDAGQLFTRLATLTLPIPEAKSQPGATPYAGAYEPLDVDSTLYPADES